MTPARTRLALLVLVGVAALVSGCTAGQSDGDGSTIDGFEWGFTPESIEVPVGEPVTVTFRNTGSIAHNLGGDFGRTDTIQADQTADLTVTFDEPGDYVFWCGVSGHRDAGMEGRFVAVA